MYRLLTILLLLPMLLQGQINLDNNTVKFNNGNEVSTQYGLNSLTSMSGAKKIGTYDEYHSH